MSVNGYFNLQTLLVEANHEKNCPRERAGKRNEPPELVILILTQNSFLKHTLFLINRHYLRRKFISQCQKKLAPGQFSSGIVNEGAII